MLVVLGIIITFIMLATVLVSVRYRLRRSPRWIKPRCPRCKSFLYRVHRNPLDRLISLYVPVRHYSCEDPDCGWVGLRVQPWSPWSKWS